MTARRRPVLTLLASLVAVSAVVACVPASTGGPGAGPGTSPSAACPMFPADHVWHAEVRGLPAHPRSAQWKASIGGSDPLKADFGSGQWAGGPIGIPYDVVRAGQPRVPVGFQYASESDPGPYPIPPGAAVEHGSDHHVLVVDESDCTLYELFDAAKQQDGSWRAGSGARFDLRGYSLRPAGWTSADAAGLAILPGLVRYDEVASGRIDHPIRFTAQLTQRAYLWPARHFASSSTDPNRPPMGAWFRLRPDFDTSGMAPQARVIAEALKTHGMILADNGSDLYMSGAPDPRWDNAALRQLAAITTADFTAVDASSLMVHPDSGQVRR